MDSRIRELIHSLVITTSIDKDKRLCMVKFFKTHVDALSGDLYRQYFFHPSGRQLTRIAIPLPPLHLRRQYEKLKGKFRDQLQSSLLAGFVKLENDIKRKAPFDFEKACKYVMGNMDDFTKTLNTRTFVDTHLIAIHFNASRDISNKIKAFVEKQATRTADRLLSNVL